ncbi:MATH and LRR domain-containing protein PFE0570w isoform X2 [Hydra vulgaris]|uniref:MATH and LRR domain-containing protein PFE0570w isoform X2 n=1 Tax=Hydra vulgaris TaxID=6087 RepID=A0ABM4CZB3_HYDVU
MAFVESEPEVYRRKKSVRVDLNDRQRIIGGIGRPRSNVNGPSSINDRILQYGKSTENGTATGKPLELNNNEIVSTPRRRISTATSPDYGKILNLQSNDNSRQISNSDVVNQQNNNSVISRQNNENLLSLQNNEINSIRNENNISEKNKEKTLTSENNEKTNQLSNETAASIPKHIEKNVHNNDSVDKTNEKMQSLQNVKPVSSENTIKTNHLQSIEEADSPENNEKIVSTQNSEKFVNYQRNQKNQQTSDDKSIIRQTIEKSASPDCSTKYVGSQNNEKAGLYSGNEGRAENHSVSLKAAANTIIKIKKEEKLAHIKSLEKNNESNEKAGHIKLIEKPSIKSIEKKVKPTDNFLSDNEKTINLQKNEVAVASQTTNGENLILLSQSNIVKQENFHKSSFDMQLSEAPPKNQNKENSVITNKKRLDSNTHSTLTSKSSDRLNLNGLKAGLHSGNGHAENHFVSLKAAANTIIKLNKEEKLANTVKNIKGVSPPLNINSARNKFLELEKHSTDQQGMIKKNQTIIKKKSSESSSCSIDCIVNKEKHMTETPCDITSEIITIPTSFSLSKENEKSNSLQSLTDSEKCTIKDNSLLIEYQLTNNNHVITNNASVTEDKLENSELIQIDSCSPDITIYDIKSDRFLTSNSDTMPTEVNDLDNDSPSEVIPHEYAKTDEENYSINNAKISEEIAKPNYIDKQNNIGEYENLQKNTNVNEFDSIINSQLTDSEINLNKNNFNDGELKYIAEEVQINTDRQNPKSDIIYAFSDKAESNDIVEKEHNSTCSFSDSDTSSNLNKLSTSSTEETGELNNRKKLVKRRARKAEEVFSKNHLAETKNDNELECNNFSDESSKSGDIDTCLSDKLNDITDYSALDAANDSRIKQSLHSEEESIVQSSIAINSNENLFTEINCCNKSETIESHEIIKNIKSSSMTAISNRLPQSLHSFSTSDMGGLENKNQTRDGIEKFENIKNLKQGPLSSFTSISKVSTLKLQSFVAKNPMFSPPLPRRSNSTTENPGLTEISEGQHNIIQTNPFSMSIGKCKNSESNKSNDDQLINPVSKSLPRNMWLKNSFDIDKNPFSSASKQRTPSEEEESVCAAKLLENLPSSPFALIKRFSEDTKRMQEKSPLGLKNENYTDLDNDSENTLYSFRDKRNEMLESNSTMTQDEHKKDISSNPKVKTRPPLNIKSINCSNVDEINTNTDSSASKPVCPRRRPSYHNANNDYFSCLNVAESLTKTQENQVNKDDNIVKAVDTNPPSTEQLDSDDDETLPDFSKIVENADKTRSRTSFPQPFLTGIPEEHRNNRHRVNKTVLSGIFPEYTINEESSDNDSETAIDKTESYCDNKLTNEKHLSLENLSSDCKMLEDNRAKSLTSLPTITCEENTKHPDIRTPKIITSSLSDPSLSNVLLKSSSSSSLNPQAITAIENNEVIGSKASLSAEKKKTPKVEMRNYVVNNLLETEQSYVQSLSTMITKFSEPLKRPENSSVIEPNVVDEIFYQIPEILEHHEIFLSQLTDRVNAWDNNQVVGDLFVTSFTKTYLMDAYSNFINNFIQAKAAIRQAVNSRPQFARFLEQCTRENREKLTLSDLLIMPVQRIPRYKLLLLDMLKYTPENHPDYENIHLAIEEIEALADRMNKGEMDADQAERDIERLRDIENTIEGVQDLVTASRRFVRQDLVAEKEGAQTKKDRCLFLFSDLLICTTQRRKNNALRRGSLGLFTGQSAADMNRYKFLWKVHLDDVEISKATNSQAIINNSEIDKLEEDLHKLKIILANIETLYTPHHNVEGSIRELTNDVRQRIQEQQYIAMQSQTPYKARIDLQALTEDGLKEYTFNFLSPECKASWLSFFEETKQKLVYSANSIPPEFQYPVPITKTRSGMQFTCASPNQTIGNYSDMSPQQSINGEVWVCNSDGYVGQVCLISMVPEAQSKASLSVCSVRILCLAAVPGGRLLNKYRNSSNQSKSNAIDFNPKKIRSRNGSIKKSLPSESDDDDLHNNAANIMAFDSSDDEEMESPYMGSLSFDGRMSPDGSSLGTVESQEGDPDSSDDYNNTISDEEDSTRKDLRREYSNLSSEVNDQINMWLGTEDGNIYVYNASDVIAQRKTKTKLQHGAPVTAILYFESRVFVALGSGELCVYTRDQATNVWQTSKPEKINVSISGSPISCITAVAGRIWCGCQNTIVLVNAATLDHENTFTVSSDHTKVVHKIVSSGLGVWVSMQNSATVRLYHGTTYENVTEIDVTPAVNKMLAGADAIIRQHKSACLRVTSMLICKDLLWIGTSAGVILTNPLPSITASTSVLRNSLSPTGSPYGHTGHVRFLTLVEVAKSQFKTVESNKDNSKSSPWLGTSRRESTKSLRNDNNTSGVLTLVVSGGDGYEDFRYSQQSETVGRDDSTNHLLIWRV